MTDSEWPPGDDILSSIRCKERKPSTFHTHDFPTWMYRNNNDIRRQVDNQPVNNQSSPSILSIIICNIPHHTKKDYKKSSTIYLVVVVVAASVHKQYLSHNGTRTK